jgi:hypothetical protein
MNMRASNLALTLLLEICRRPAARGRARLPISDVDDVDDAASDPRQLIDNRQEFSHALF